MNPSQSRRFIVRLLGIAVVWASLVCATSTRAAAPAPPVPPVTVAAPAPPAGLTYEDVANDAGNAVRLTWRKSPDDSVGLGRVAGYLLERGRSPVGPWETIDSLVLGSTERVDGDVQRRLGHAQAPAHRVVIEGARATPGLQRLEM